MTAVAPTYVHFKRHITPDDTLTPSNTRLAIAATRPEALECLAEIEARVRVAERRLPTQRGECA